MPKKHNLSKSRFLLGLQCPKLLWMSVHSPDEEGPVDEATQHRFDVGQRVGEYAQKCFKGGVLIDEDHNHIGEAIKSTEKYSREGASALYEATASYNNILCRVDILKRVKDKQNLWDLYEVKSTTGVKEQHIPDIAIQRYCFEGAGYPVRKAFLMHLNNKYVRQGDIDPSELMVAEDVTDRVSEQIGDIEQKAKYLIDILGKDKCPDIAIGGHCTEPYDCPFYESCQEPEEEYTINELSRGKKVIATLEALGIKYLKDVPDDFSLSLKHEQHVLSNKRKKPVITASAIKAHLDKLVYPLYHFDFETIMSAIPLFDNSRPYQNLPFQFSLHIQHEPCGECEHIPFLLKEAHDPREELIKTILDNIGKTGSIVSYNASFEQNRIKELARDFPQYAKRLLAILPRFWDLIVPFRSGDYTHYEFHGSASLKYVLPVLVPSLSYDELEVQEGGTASLLAEKWYAGDMGKKEWKQVHENLLEYCKLDTLGMVEILKVLYDAVK